LTAKQQIFQEAFNLPWIFPNLEIWKLEDWLLGNRFVDLIKNHISLVLKISMIRGQGYDSK
jgi:hypothetical protein